MSDRLTPPVDAPSQAATLSDSLFRRRVATTVIIVAIAVIALLLLWVTRGIVLQIFISILIAVGLRGLTDLISDHTPLGKKAALVVAIIGIVALFAVGTILLGQRIAAQFDQLVEQLPQSLDRIRDQLDDYSWGRALIRELPTTAQLDNLLFGDGENAVFVGATDAVSSSLTLLTSLLIILILGIFFAVEPDIYVRNAVRLAPLPKRPRFREILSEVASKPRKWLLSRLISMVIVGILTTIGLMLLGTPLALALGIIAGVLSFIPTFGPIISVIPAVLLGLLNSPTQALYIIVLYIVVQQIDNYLITPFVERVTISMPPGVVVVTQLLLTVLVGFLGLVLAAPLAETLIVLVRALYVEDVLHDYQPEG